MNEADRHKIEKLLGTSSLTDSFVEWLEGATASFAHPKSFFKRHDIKPHSKETRNLAKATKQACDRATALLDKLQYELSLKPTERDAIQHHIEESAAIRIVLDKVVNRTAPSRRDKRLYPERYFLLQLMSALKQCYPNYRISAAVQSKFYRIAKLALAMIGYRRADIRWLIKEEKEAFLQDAAYLRPPFRVTDRGKRDTTKILTAIHLKI